MDGNVFDANEIGVVRKETGMTENEKFLQRENVRLEGKIEELQRKLQIAENFNYQMFREKQELSEYIRNMEGWCRT